MSSGAVTVSIYGSFDDLPLGDAAWERLLASGPTNEIFLTREWQHLWWENYSGRRLLLVVAERNGEPVALAPLFAFEDMLFLVGSGDSDYLDLVGSPTEAELAAMLQAAIREMPEFVGLRLYHVPVASTTTSLLPGAAERLGLELDREGDMLAPYLSLADRSRVLEMLERRKLRKEENRMRNLGPLQVRLARSEELDPWLEAFFAQHTARWRAAGEPGLERDDNRAFLHRIVHAGHAGGWLRFTMLEWRECPAAFDITLVHRGRHLSYLVARDASVQRHSPGRLLEAHVIRHALETGAECYDFGLGEEEYKLAHASGMREVVSWGLWPQ